MGKTGLIIALPLLIAGCMTACTSTVSIETFGAKGDGVTLNTEAIQSAIDAAASAGGGTVTVPEGVFVSGALFLKPGVHLSLKKGGVIRCSTDLANFPEQRTRIEGHFEEAFNPALINADGCDGLVISGEGTLDGAGKPVWDEFWARRNAAADPWSFRNLDVARARLCLVENSKNVTVKGITFKDSQFWNLHLYNCQNVLVENARFTVPDGENPPSSDGVDIDSSQDVMIRGCYFSVNDDCVSMKGTKGPFALEDTVSLPVERVTVTNCTFRRGHHAVCCGSEATFVRDVVIEDCVLADGSDMPLLRLKLRPDTPQCYEDLAFRNIRFEGGGSHLIQIEKWTQYFDLQGRPEPESKVRNIRFSTIRGDLASIGKVGGNAQTVFGEILLDDIDITAKAAVLSVSEEAAPGIRCESVLVNGAVFTSLDCTPEQEESDSQFMDGRNPD